MFNISIRDNWDLILVLLIYSFFSFILFGFFLYTGADGISYISIAKYYAAGNWADAINGYWSPLYSWLMVPFFLLFDFEPFYAVYVTHTVSLIAGFFTILGMWRLANKFELESNIKRAITLSTLPIILYTAFILDTPDLILICILVFYFSVIFDPNYSEKIVNGLVAGILGSIAYFSKTYALAFFVVHFIVFNLLFYFKGLNKDKRNNILKNLVFGLSIFIILSGTWIGAISYKYEELTIGTSGEYNHALVGPGNGKHPVYLWGLINPPTNNAVNIWEDPSYMLMKDWSPLESGDYFIYQLKLLWKNIVDTMIIIEAYSLLSLIIIISALIFISRKKFNYSRKEKLAYLIVTMVIYTGGYCLIFVGWKYLLPVCFLLILTGFYLIDSIHQEGKISTRLNNIFLVFLMLSFMVIPTINIVSSMDSVDDVPNLSETLAREYGVQGNLASNDEWLNSLRIAYFLDSSYYGLTKENKNVTAIETELENYNIEYYFVWNETDSLEFSNYYEITGGELEGLKIYKIKS